MSLLETKKMKLQSRLESLRSETDLLNGEKFEVGAKTEKILREIQKFRSEKDEHESALGEDQKYLLEKLQVSKLNFAGSSVAFLSDHLKTWVFYVPVCNFLRNVF